MSDPLDVCPQCSDPWCSCDCALCDFVGNSPEATAARKMYEEESNKEDRRQFDRYRLVGADRHCLDGSKLRKEYYRRLILQGR